MKSNNNQTSSSTLLGVSIVKKFDVNGKKVPFKGIVTKVHDVIVDHAVVKGYRVLYDDGDEEDLLYKDILKLRVPVEENEPDNIVDLTWTTSTSSKQLAPEKRRHTLPANSPKGSKKYKKGKGTYISTSGSSSLKPNLDVARRTSEPNEVAGTKSNVGKEKNNLSLKSILYSNGESTSEDKSSGLVQEFAKKTGTNSKPLKQPILNRSVTSLEKNKENKESKVKKGNKKTLFLKEKKLLSILQKQNEIVSKTLAITTEAHKKLRKNQENKLRIGSRSEDRNNEVIPPPNTTIETNTSTFVSQENVAGNTSLTHSTEAYQPNSSQSVDKIDKNQDKKHKFRVTSPGPEAKTAKPKKISSTLRDNPQYINLSTGSLALQSSSRGKEVHYSDNMNKSQIKISKMPVASPVSEQKEQNSKDLYSNMRTSKESKRNLRANMDLDSNTSNLSNAQKPCLIAITFDKTSHIIAGAMVELAFEGRTIQDLLNFFEKEKARKVTRVVIEEFSKKMYELQLVSAIYSTRLLYQMRFFLCFKKAYFLPTLSLEDKIKYLRTEHPEVLNTLESGRLYILDSLINYRLKLYRSFVRRFLAVQGMKEHLLSRVNKNRLYLYTTAGYWDFDRDMVLSKKFLEIEAKLCHKDERKKLICLNFKNGRKLVQVSFILERFELLIKSFGSLKEISQVSIQEFDIYPMLKVFLTEIHKAFIKGDTLPFGTIKELFPIYLSFANSSQ